jgi:hypothetical protein
MTNEIMTNFLDKMKKKMQEQHTTFSVTQQIIVNHNVVTIDLSSEINSEEIVKLCKKYQSSEYKESKTEYVNAWRSDYHLVSNRAMPEFDVLFDVVHSKIEKIKGKEYSHYTELIDHYWFAIYQPGDYSNIHNHGNVNYACVYYASVPENSAPLVLPAVNGEDVTIIPKTGLLVIMPGQCYHKVPVSAHENGERIIVAMNVVRKLIEPDRSNIILPNQYEK